MYIYILQTCIQLETAKSPQSHASTSRFYYKQYRVNLLLKMNIKIPILIIGLRDQSIILCIMSHVSCIINIESVDKNQHMQRQLLNWYS